jgi:hypothetical protein
MGLNICVTGSSRRCRLLRTENKTGTIIDGAVAGSRLIRPLRQLTRECDYLFHKLSANSWIDKAGAQPQFQMVCERPPAAFGGSLPHEEENKALTLQVLISPS